MGPGHSSQCLFHTEIQENVISPFDTSRIKEDVLHSKHAELKDRLRGINQGYDRLRRVSHRGYGTQADEHTAPLQALCGGIVAMWPTLPCGVALIPMASCCPPCSRPRPGCPLFPASWLVTSSPP